MANRDAVFPAQPHALFEMHRYSPAVRSNGFLFVSGQVGARQDGSPEPELAAQTKLAVDHLTAILAAAGCSFDDVVDATIFIVNPETNLPTIWPVITEHWGTPPYPALTAVGVTWLSGFTVEIKVIARVPQVADPC